MCLMACSKTTPCYASAISDHYADTHGLTEHIFGLCYLLGYSFKPRLRDLADQHVFKMDRRADHGCLNPLFDW
jgi:TnpA family transposase